MHGKTDAPGDQAAPVVCRLLRSKGAGVVYGDAIRWENGFYPTAVFWCLTTADPVGPDDGLAHPHVCVASRSCFSDIDSNPTMARERT
jgi:hypothetical protein